MRAALDSGDVDVRYELIEPSMPGAPAPGLHLLSERERARAARFVFERDRAAFVAAHALLRRVLSAHADVLPGEWTFSENAFGKPALDDRHAGTGLAFNIAHTKGLVACAVGRGGDIGIDAEAIRPEMQPLDIARRFFSAPELTALESCDPDARHGRFTDFWALKESYVKAIGQGLSHALDTFSFAIEAQGLRFQPPPDDRASWQFALFAPSPLHRLAIAATRPDGAARRVTARREDGSGELRPVYTCAVQPPG